MKQLTILIALLVTSFGFSQDTVRHHFTVSYASNGQIADMVNDFYFSENELYEVKQSIFKFAAAYSLQTKRGAEFGLQLGFGQRKDRYTQEIIEDRASQQYFSVMPFALKTWEFNRFNISTGGGVPLNIIGEYHFRGADYLNKMLTGTLEGGFAAGLNSITQLRFFLAPRLALTTSIQFGWLYADFGGEFRQTPDDPNYTPLWLTQDYRKVKRNIFTQPEFCLGVGFRL